MLCTYGYHIAFVLLESVVHTFLFTSIAETETFNLKAPGTKKLQIWQKAHENNTFEIESYNNWKLATSVCI